MNWKRCSLHLALVTSIAANTWLARDDIRLRSMLAGLAARHILSVGSVVEALALATQDGRHVTVNCGDVGGPTVLYVLSPTCKWCEKNAASVNSLSAKLSRPARLVAISLAGRGTPVAFPAWPTPSPAYAGDSDEIGRQLRIRSTPTTIVLSNRGVVLAVWEGAYAGRVKSDIEKYFGVALPDIGDDRAASPRGSR
jgi:hypothetical protein